MRIADRRDLASTADYPAIESKATMAEKTFPAEQHVLKTFAKLVELLPAVDQNKESKLLFLPERLCLIAMTPIARCHSVRSGLLLSALTVTFVCLRC
ncbi:hypothetical protein C8Q80DRAFT_183135 [Daedaleopsis nitida]|nr:hypothetical protein C8Q80DRAFT_183135 [Daedaleopsis nitida]